jgi:hypothetical protein
MYHVIWTGEDRDLQESFMELLLSFGQQINLRVLDFQYRRPPLALAGSLGNNMVCEALLRYLKCKEIPINRVEFYPKGPFNVENQSQIEKCVKRHQAS